MTDRNFRYWAFISYSHGDEALAVKLHRALEQYSLPLNVRRAHNLPRRLIPIFRDVDELAAASQLTPKLQRALDESRWLIVLCSPSSAASRYVNEEVGYFIDRHGADRVLCVLADGEPAECFPAAIRELGIEPLAADCRAGKDVDAAKLKLIAAMAVVGYTDLRNREAQRRRRARIAMTTAASMIAVCGIAYWDLFVRTHVDDYVNYVRINGIWHGIDPISAKRAERRSASYRFTRHGRLQPPERVEYFHGCGSQEKRGMADLANRPFAQVDEFARGACTAVFVYHGDGTIASESMLNRYGVQVLTLSYTTPTLAQFTLSGFASSTSKAGMRYVQIERDDDGRDRAVRFLYAQDMPSANDRGDFGYHFEYDAAGRIVSRSVLDDAGNEVGEVTRYRYDAAGDLLDEEYVDGSGKPLAGRQGYASVHYRRDADGNEIDERYLDEHGAPAADGDGVYRYRLTYDAHGNVIEVRDLDADGKPMLNIRGTAGMRNHYDERGFLVRREFIDPQGRITADVEGYAINESDYDAHGSVVDDRFLDADGKPTVRDIGFSIQRNEYDERGQLTVQRFFGVDGKPVLTRWGATLRDVYNRHGDIVSFQFFDADGKPYLRPDVGNARVDIERDDAGVAVSSTFLDASLQPRRSRTQPAYRQFKHDPFGRIIEWRNLDPDRKPMRIQAGYAIERCRYDRQGNKVEDRYFDADESPIAIPGDGYGWSAEYDHQGRITEKRFLDRDGNPGDLSRGYASVRYGYGIGNRVLSETYLDVEGQPIVGRRLAGRAFLYDAHGRSIEQRYADGRGLPIRGPLGFASLRTQYDDSGRVIGERALDEHDALVDRDDQHWATHEISYDAQGRKDRYLSAAGAEVAVPAP